MLKEIKSEVNKKKGRKNGPGKIQSALEKVKVDVQVGEHHLCVQISSSDSAASGV